MDRFLCASSVQAVRLIPEMKSNLSLMPLNVTTTGYQTSADKEFCLRCSNNRVQYGKAGDWYVIFPWGQPQIIHDTVFKHAFVHVDEIKQPEFSKETLKKIKKAVAWFSKSTGWGE
jgi:hypothetical protein